MNMNCMVIQSLQRQLDQVENEEFKMKNRKWNDHNIQERISMKVVPLDIEPKGWGNNANMVTLGIYNEGYKKEHIWVYYLKNMAMCTNLKRYYMSMKKYQKGWR